MSHDNATMPMPMGLLGSPTPVPMPKSWPGLFGDLALWLDASDDYSLFSELRGGGGVPAGGQTVAGWADKGPRRLRFENSVANGRPTRRVAIQNGLDGLQFDGNDSLYAATNIFDGAVSVMAVFRLNSLTRESPLCDLGTYSADGGFAAPFIVVANVFGTAGQRMGAYLNTSGTTAGGDTTYDSSAATTLKTRVVVVSADVGPLRPLISSTRYRVDGIERTLTRRAGETATTYGPRYQTFGGAMIGAYNNNGSGSFPCDAWLFEIMAFSRQLSQAECIELEQYAASKWGLQL